jgi:hypothetical protein
MVKIVVTVPESHTEVVPAIRKVHPYEEPVIDAYLLLDIDK